MPRTSRTLLTRQPSYSTDRGLQLYGPTRWSDLTQEQLRWLLGVMCRCYDRSAVKTYMFCTLCGVDVKKRTAKGYRCIVRVPERKVVYLHAWQVQALIGQFDFIDHVEDCDVRLEHVKGYHAADVNLRGVAFEDYLLAERYYQLYLIHRQDRFLSQLARYLYHGADGQAVTEDVQFEPEHLLGVFFWYQHVKKVLAENFPNFFRRGEYESEDYDLIAEMNTQIRALTGGDVLKEAAIRKIDCWRALTELDAKAHEIEMQRKQLEKIRNKS